MPTNEELIAVAIEQLPSIISLIRDQFVTRNPSLPVPTDEEIHAAYVTARDSSLAKDDAWRAAHPQ